jgi:hypothetical protein
MKPRYATMEERRRPLARLVPSPLATMTERLAAVPRRTP